MVMDIAKEELKKMLTEIIESEGFEFVEMKLARHGKHHSLRVFADRQGGISLDQCGSLSRTLGRKLEEIEPFGSAYTLEVSSPGIDRPLKYIQQFKRNIGRSFELQLEDGNGSKLEGKLLELDNDDLKFQIKKEVKVINIKNIKSAKVLVRF